MGALARRSARAVPGLRPISIDGNAASVFRVAQLDGMFIPSARRIRTRARVHPWSCVLWTFAQGRVGLPEQRRELFELLQVVDGQVRSEVGTDADPRLV